MPKKERKLTAIGTLFEKYKRTLRAPQGVVIDAFIEVVNDLIGISIPKDRVRYSPGQKTLSLQVSGPLKTEIKLRETEILIHLKGRLGAPGAPKQIL
ncbi:MAG: hypothetical protein AUK16_03320 [Parcubacteria group bacterium CG2_30_44_11]|nr:MAG: hypothetical protein AUK16_03320 [Parcubacteria group bacterium CG2_30_44_11]